MRSVKIPEQAYHEAKQLATVLKEEKVLPGMHDISLGEAISYAIDRALLRARMRTIREMRLKEAIRVQDKLAKKIGKWDTAAEIRKWRDQRYSS